MAVGVVSPVGEADGGAGANFLVEASIGTGCGPNFIFSILSVMLFTPLLATLQLFENIPFVSVTIGGDGAAVGIGALRAFMFGLGRGCEKVFAASVFVLLTAFLLIETLGFVEDELDCFCLSSLSGFTGNGERRMLYTTKWRDLSEHSHVIVTGK